MRTKTIIKIGKFWLRSDPSNQVSGELKIENGGEITLTSIGLLHEGLEVVKYFDILGELEGQKFITLQGCSYRRRNLFNHGVATSIIKSERAIESGQFVSEKEPLFNEISFSTDLLIEWLALSSISVTNHETHSSLVVGIFEPIEYQLSNGDLITIFFNNSGPSTPVSNVVTIEQVAILRYSSKILLSLNDLLAKADSVRKFVSLGIGLNVSLSDVLVHSIETQDIFPEKGLRVYFKDANFKEVPGKLSSHDMLFTYHEIKKDFPNYLESWIQLSESESDVIDQYFSVMGGKALNEEMGFLHYAQGLESLHRNCFQDSGYLPEKEFESLLNLLKEASPEQHRDWIYDKLKHGNSLPFSKRVKILVGKYPETFGNGKQRKRFIENVFNARNILTHQGKEQLSKHLKGQTICDVKNLVRILYQRIFMELIGFSSQLSNSLLSKNEQTKSVLARSLPTT